MADFGLIALAGILILMGGLFCLVPILPGPIIAMCGLLCVFMTERSFSLPILVVFGAAVLIVTILDYIVPALGAKRFQSSGWGVFGCVVGTIIGIFFFPIGVIAGPFLGACLGEIVAGKNLAPAIRGGIGAFVGFICGVVLKLTVCCSIGAYYINWI